VTPPATQDAERRRRLVILAICCISIFMVAIDGTIVNVALPSIRRALGASIPGLQWTVDAYAVGVAALLMLSGSMGDRFGRRRVFMAGLSVFTLGSLLCGVAPNLGCLIGFRALQAVGGSALNPIAMSIIRSTFDDSGERSRAVGLWGATIGAGGGLGPLLGGLLVQSVGWRYIFWVNVPIGIAAIVLAAAYLPESRALRPRPFDAVGQLLVLVLLSALTFAIIEGSELGWLSPTIVSLGVLSAAIFVALPLYEARRPQPLLDPRFFRNVPFTGSVLIAICAFAALGGSLFLGTLYLQTVRGLSPLTAGAYTLPSAVGTMVLSVLTGRFLARHGVRWPFFATGVGLTISALLFLTATADTPLWQFGCAYAVLGISLGTANPPITTTAIASIPGEQGGVASAIASMSRGIGSTLGVAIVGAVVTSRLTGNLRHGLLHADRPGWFVVVGLGVLTIVLALVTTTQRALFSTASANTERVRVSVSAVPEAAPTDA
jgi:EmrB/QacA subfamily drug resistance transporter